MKLIKFYGSYCSPCKALTKSLSEIDFKENFEIVSYNVEEEIDLVEDYKIKSVPTCILVDDNGSEVKRWIGTFNIKEELKEFIV